MIELDILYFAWVRERVGIPKERISTNAQTVAELVDELCTRDPHYAAAFQDRAIIKAAVNQVVVPFDTSLKTAKEVAFFPPMTGG